MQWKPLTLITALFLLAAGWLAAQARPGNAHPMYDPKTEVTMTGTIDNIQQYSGRDGASTGTHVFLKTATGVFDVHVGPSGYLSKQGFALGKGDQIEVTGSKLKMGDTEALIAREIKKGGKVLILRNAQGIPAWRGGRRGPS